MENIILYNTEDGKASVKLYAENNTVWLTQAQMALLFDCSTDNISLHLKNIYKEEELNREATTEKSSVVQKEGDCQVTRPIKSCWTMTFPCSGHAASIPMRT